MFQGEAAHRFLNHSAKEAAHGVGDQNPRSGAGRCVSPGGLIQGLELPSVLVDPPLGGSRIRQGSSIPPTGGCRPVAMCFHLFHLLPPRPPERGSKWRHVENAFAKARLGMTSA